MDIVSEAESLWHQKRSKQQTNIRVTLRGLGEHFPRVQSLGNPQIFNLLVIFHKVKIHNIGSF